MSVRRPPITMGRMDEIATPDTDMLGNLSVFRRARADEAAKSKPLGLRRVLSSEQLLFVLLVAPNLILFAVFSFWPMIYSFFLSTRRWDLIAPVKKPVGFDNYRYLYHDRLFNQVMRNTLYFTVAAVGGTLILGLLVALLLNQPLRGRNGARAVIFAPSLLSGAAISVVWIYMFDPRFGIIARLLSLVHIASPSW